MSSQRFVRVTVPPKATLIANILSQPGMGADVLSSDGTQVLRSIEGTTVTTIHCGRRYWLDADPTVDYCPESSRTVTRIEHPNTDYQPVDLRGLALTPIVRRRRSHSRRLFAQ
jgi:hypothetical protein